MLLVVSPTYVLHYSVYLRILWVQAITVKPLNKGHFGSMAFLLYSEVVLWWEVEITIVISIGVIASVLCIEDVHWWEGPLWEVPLYLA